MDKTSRSLLSINSAISDPYVNGVTLLLKGDGTNGATNESFVDSSSNNNTVDNGSFNVCQGTFSPYDSNWSNYFDGTGDYLTTSNNAAFGFGTDDFTVEGWFLGTGRHFFFGTGAVDGLLVSSNTTHITCYDPSAGTLNGSWSPSSWNHVAVTRQSSTLKLYVNGIMQSSGTSLQNWPTQEIQIGYGGSSYGSVFTGYISNFRVLKGISRYNTDFASPTTPLTAIANTSLLTCKSNRIIDISSNNFTITKAGDVSVQSFSPFSRPAPYSASTDGASMFFDIDASSSYLRILTGSFNLGVSNFVIEGWAYLTNSSGGWLFTKYGTNAVSSSYEISITGGQIQAVFYHEGSNPSALTQLQSFVNIGINEWHHWIVQRYGGEYSLYLDGVRLTTTTNNTSTRATSNYPYIGTLGLNFTSTYKFPGYICDIRVIKDNSSPVYSGATYTVPTSPLTVTTNTILLLSAKNGGIIDNARINIPFTQGSSQITTVESKFGGSSILCGSASWLELKRNVNLALGSGDFTIEMWVYGVLSSNSSTVGGSWPRLFTFGTSQGTGCIETYISSGTDVIVSISAGTDISFSASTLINTSWNHFAITRAGTSLKAFVNGTQVGSTATNSTNLNLAANTSSSIGATNLTVGNFTGYLDDFRVTKGYARYTTTFTPPDSIPLI